jgi:hypothetical protein
VGGASRMVPLGGNLELIWYWEREGVERSERAKREVCARRTKGRIVIETSSLYSLSGLLREQRERSSSYRLVPGLLALPFFLFRWHFRLEIPLDFAGFEISGPFIVGAATRRRKILNFFFDRSLGKLIMSSYSAEQAPPC